MEKIPTIEFQKFVCDLMCGVSIEEASENLIGYDNAPKKFVGADGFPRSFKQYIKRNETYFQLCVLARAYFLQSQVAYAYPNERAYHNYMLLCQACEEIVDFLTDSAQEKDDPGFLRRVLGSLRKLRRKNS